MLRAETERHVFDSMISDFRYQRDIHAARTAVLRERLRFPVLVDANPAVCRVILHRQRGRDNLGSKRRTDFFSYPIDRLFAEYRKSPPREAHRVRARGSGQQRIDYAPR